MAQACGAAYLARTTERHDPGHGSSNVEGSMRKLSVKRVTPQRCSQFNPTRSCADICTHSCTNLLKGPWREHLPSSSSSWWLPLVVVNSKNQLKHEKTFPSWSPRQQIDGADAISHVAGSSWPPGNADGASADHLVRLLTCGGLWSLMACPPPAPLLLHFCRQSSRSLMCLGSLTAQPDCLGT